MGLLERFGLNKEAAQLQTRLDRVNQDYLRISNVLAETQDKLTTTAKALREANEARDTLAETLDVRTRELDATKIAFGNTVSSTNNQLYAVGKILVDLVAAWKFRETNPKMSPKLRVENNVHIGQLLTTLATTMPKRVDVPLSTIKSSLGVGSSQ